jgi:amino-acid N-acetyltransferase
VSAPVQIEPAQSTDRDDVLRLVEQSGLPRDGLVNHLATALVARHGGRIVGSAALEMYPDGALLRSVAVAREFQGQGIGHRLTDAAISLARERRVPALYLLTTTADQFFPRFGFERIERTAVPRTVQSSVEFTSACPSSATVMRRPMESARAAVPLVCTLGPGELNARAMELLPGLVRRARTVLELDDGCRLEFSATSEVLRALTDTIEAERQCCRFLRFQLVVEPDAHGIVLEVTGPAGTKDFLYGLRGDDGAR